MIVYQTGPEKTEGGQREVIVSDDNAQTLLNGILRELKKTNMYNSLISDNEITDMEVS